MTIDKHPDSLNQIREELKRARDARSQGNEGMARVCSRRAAGIAIGVYLSHQGYYDVGSSAYERLNIVKSLPNMPQQVQIAAEHLLLRVNEEHELPGNIDLIKDSHHLIHFLLTTIET